MNNSSRRLRIFYCGIVNTTSYAARVAEPLHIGAASNKMIAVVRALRDAGVDGYLVSLPVLGHKARNRAASAMVLRSRDGPQVFLPVVANRYFRMLYAFLSFGWFCLIKVRKSDRVILYNHAVEYLLGLAILLLKGNRPFLDVEDAPRDDQRGLQAAVGSTLFSLFFRFTHNGKLIVSQALARMLGLSRYCVVYGATRNGAGLREGVQPSPWDTLDAASELSIHFGGSLCTDTGVDLFCDAGDQLAASLPRDRRQVHFIVTGFGAEERIKALAGRCDNTGIRVTFYPDASPDEYLDLFLRCQAALCLKLPESDMAMTTFPSKVVEITAHGLLLISTKASDIPYLFDHDNAVLLPEATPGELAKAIMLLVAEPQAMQQVARRGQARAMELFESKAVGKRINDFVLNEHA